MTTSISGQLVDIKSRTIFPARVEMTGNRISGIIRLNEAPDQYILPGFIDAHIHIESSMLVPYEFAKIAMRHGTIATVSDPHEIANVLGIEGVEFMLDSAVGAGLKFHFGAPSCVPATSFESAGAELDANAVHRLLQRADIYYLSEMMNYPGVLHGDPEVHQKMKYARQLGKPVDGHAPGLRGEEARRYIEAGITTDHECYQLDEALDKLSYGMKIIIREGSAAKNYDALHTLIGSHPDAVMFCSDDKHPDDLIRGHINELVIRSIRKGYDLFDVLQIACVNPVEHYGMNVGLLRTGDSADCLVVSDLKDFTVKEVYIDGTRMTDGQDVFLPDRSCPQVNRFRASPKEQKDFLYHGPCDPVPVIRAIDGELITRLEWYTPKADRLESDILSVEEDLLKIVVVNRYRDEVPAVGYIRGFGLKSGALASTVAHDSHNIVAVGTNDDDLCKAVNALIDQKGGLAISEGNSGQVMALPIAGLMSDEEAGIVASKYEHMDRAAKQLGSVLTAPFMTMSFMALLVIPEIKMSDKGIFDAKKFEFF